LSQVISNYSWTHVTCSSFISLSKLRNIIIGSYHYKSMEKSLMTILYIHIRYFKSTVFIFILNRCYDIYFLCYMTINSNQYHVTFLYIEFLLGYLNIDCEFEVQKKLWQNPDQLISMPMEYWTPYPWYIDPPTNGISTKVNQSLTRSA
jgi:hypothetical protein